MNVEAESSEEELRMPVDVRLAALAIIAVGLCFLSIGIINLWYDASPWVAVYTFLIPLGWCLLRCQEWARKWVAGLSLLGLIVAIINSLISFPPFWKAVLESNLAEANIDTFYFPTSFACLIFTAWVHRSVARNPVRHLFKNPTSSKPLVEWNPKKWRFGIGTLLYLTLVVALIATLLVRDPRRKLVRAERWSLNTNWNDEFNFPFGIREIPSHVNPKQYDLRYEGGEAITLLYYRLVPNEKVMGEPVKVGYVVFDHTLYQKLGEYGRSFRTLGCRNSYSDYGYFGAYWEATFHSADLPEITFPGPVQIAEYRYGELFTSDMQVTAIEFWSFYQHPDSEWSIDGIEKYVEDLRKRVAEREASK